MRRSAKEELAAWRNAAGSGEWLETILPALMERQEWILQRIINASDAEELWLLKGSLETIRELILLPEVAIQEGERIVAQEENNGRGRVRTAYERWSARLAGRG